MHLKFKGLPILDYKAASHYKLFGFHNPKAGFCL
jgi:hypothetical protein